MKNAEPAKEEEEEKMMKPVKKTSKKVDIQEKMDETNK